MRRPGHVTEATEAGHSMSRTVCRQLQLIILRPHPSALPDVTNVPGCEPPATLH